MTVFLFTVLAAIDLFFLVCQEEDLIQSLLDGCDTAGILATDHVGDLFRKGERFLFYDLAVTDDVDGDAVVDKAQNIQIQHFWRTLHFNDILFAHLIAAGILDDGYAAVQLIQLQITIDLHAFSCLDVIQDKTFT